MNIGRTIRIYLEDGSVSGIKHAEIVNWTGQAVSSPRTQVKSLSEWSESKKPGVYFLFGIDETTGDSAVYIGEAENVYDRLQNHIANKDFWNEVVFFTSKDENLTKSHVKYLESRLVQVAKQAGRYSILNGNEPQLPVLPRGDRDSMEEFIANLKTLLGVIGHKALEAIASKPLPQPLQHPTNEIETTIEQHELILNTKGISAKAIMSDEGIVVLAGSTVAEEVRDSLSGGYLKLRTLLINNNVISKENGILLFTKDQLFTSPSQAAAIIVGYSINGRNSWQTEAGITLKMLEEGNGQSI